MNRNEPAEKIEVLERDAEELSVEQTEDVDGGFHPLPRPIRLLETRNDVVTVEDLALG